MPRTLLLSAPLLLAACNVFDPALYQARQDAGTGNTFALADRCDGVVPDVTPGPTALTVDTRMLANDLEDLAVCVGHSLPGNDGFFRVKMGANERWHFHVKASGDADPAIYVLPSCDARTCRPGAGLDECGPGRDEHLSFISKTAGDYFVGVDSRVAGAGAIFPILVIRPICGDGVLDHSESCDDHNTVSGDGCDSKCRVELTAALSEETEPNDDPTGANVVIPGAGGLSDLSVHGRLGGRCDFDTYAVTVPAQGSIKATVLGPAGQACTAPTPDLILYLLGADGQSILGTKTSTGGACPTLSAGGLAMAEYFVRVTTAHDVATAFEYRIHLEAKGP